MLLRILSIFIDNLRSWFLLDITLVAVRHIKHHVSRSISSEFYNSFQRPCRVRKDGVAPRQLLASMSAYGQYLHLKCLVI